MAEPWTLNLPEGEEIVTMGFNFPWNHNKSALSGEVEPASNPQLPKKITHRPLLPDSLPESYYS